MTSPKFHASLTPMFCYLFYFRDHTYSASLELVILSLVLRLSPWSLTLFSFDEQHQRYYSLFSNCIILDPKYLDIEFFEGETFDC